MVGTRRLELLASPGSTSKVRGSRTRHRILWVGLWVGCPRKPRRARITPKSQSRRSCQRIVPLNLTLQHEARERYSRISGSPEETDAHVALWRAIREGRLARVTNGVVRILGRKPITLRQWASENAKSFRS